jgi:hypothetical protein
MLYQYELDPSDLFFLAKGIRFEQGFFADLGKTFSLEELLLEAVYQTILNMMSGDMEMIGDEAEAGQ